MCDPVSMMVVMAATSMVQAKMSIDMQNKVAKATAVASNRAASFSMQQLAEKRTEVDEKAAQDKFQRQLQTKREQGRITVAMGEAGRGGASAMRVMNNAIMQGSYDTSVIEANRMSKARQITSEIHGVHLKAKGVTDVAKSQIVSGGTAAMNIGIAGVTGGMQGYMMGQSFKGTKMPTDAVDNTIDFGGGVAY